MSERRLNITETVLNKCLFAPEDDDQTIDVSAFDFSDTDRWLYECAPCSPEFVVPDLYAWLRNTEEADSLTRRRTVDTRTFTRSKKRNSKGFSEPIMETLSYYLPSRFMDGGFCNTHENESKCPPFAYQKKEPIPPMLKTMTKNINLLSEDTAIKSGQESMEAFLNISQSKGIDSFINLVEPELGDALMNISQPSILYSSIMSETKNDMSANSDFECFPKDTYKLDETFCKPTPAVEQKKLPATKTLSKLPQFLKKSNPNLVSNFKRNTDIPRCSSIPTARQVQDMNITRSIIKPTTNKLYSLGKLRSGSEQQLQHIDVNTPTFQNVGTGGSTESINSTQSAHSAPDLDDRLSASSATSHNSYTISNRNIEQLHRIIQGEDMINESIPDRQILRNTWIEKRTELPSPVLKNGSDKVESNHSPPMSIDTIITSTPTISPAASSQTINSDGNHIRNKQENNTAIIEKIADKQPNKIENKTKLKQPTNWNTRNKTHGLASGIPRPQSRIPAPKFARPNARTTISSQKKEYS